MRGLGEIMSTKNKIAVSILGQDHYLISTDDREYVNKVAKLVDDRMQIILKSNSSLNHTKIAILTALNLADDLSQARHKIEEYKSMTLQPSTDMNETKEEISTLADQVFEAEVLYDNILSELETVKSKRAGQESQLRQLAETLRIMCGDIESSDEALIRANNRIDELEEELLLRESEITEYIRVFDEIENEKLQESKSEYGKYDDRIIYEDDLEE